jgi:hypothetical protein
MLRDEITGFDGIYGNFLANMYVSKYLIKHQFFLCKNIKIKKSTIKQSSSIYRKTQQSSKIDEVLTSGRKYIRKRKEGRKACIIGTVNSEKQM